MRGTWQFGFGNSDCILDDDLLSPFLEEEMVFKKQLNERVLSVAESLRRQKKAASNTKQTSIKWSKDEKAQVVPFFQNRRISGDEKGNVIMRHSLEIVN
jgi:hypothetical protein